MEKKQGGRKKKNRKQNKFREYREIGMTLGRIYLEGRTENEYDMYIYEITKARETEPQLGYILLSFWPKGPHKNPQTTQSVCQGYRLFFTN